MQTIKLLLTVAVALAVAAPAHAATKNISITKNGFSPKNTSINAGDTVVWKNNDTVNHQVVATNGHFASPILAPTRTYTRRFDIAGTYNYRDTFKPTLTGRLVVRGAPPSVSIAASAPIITYGDTIVLGGKVSSGRAGEQVTLYAKPYGQVSYVEVARLLSADGGLWSFTVKPELLTTYQAVWNNLKSAEIATAVQPRLWLKRVGNWWVVRVSAARSFKNRWVYVQRLSPLGQWINVRKVLIGTATAQRFKIKDLPKGVSRLRLFLTVNQAGVGYLAATSSTFVFRRR